MTNVTQTRKSLKEVLQQLIDLWEGKIDDTSFMLNKARLKSFQFGEITGSDKIKEALQKDTKDYSLKIQTENIYLTGKNDQATISTYLIGDLDNKDSHYTFQGTMVLDLVFRNNRWLISQIRLIHGIDGEVPSKEWRPSFLFQASWQPGDATPVIISEFDSPWHKFPDNEFASENEEERISDLYAQYAWGIDQAYWVKLADAFDEDAESDLMPMGHQIGKRNVVGQIRQFRLAGSYLHHIGQVLNVDFTSDTTANVLLGRLISQQSVDPETGKRLYGAYYEMRVRKDEDGKWRYTFMNYQPKWFTYDK